MWCWHCLVIMQARPSVQPPSYGTSPVPSLLYFSSNSCLSFSSPPCTSRSLLFRNIQRLRCTHALLSEGGTMDSFGNAIVSLICNRGRQKRWSEGGVVLCGAVRWDSNVWSTRWLYEDISTADGITLFLRSMLVGFGSTSLPCTYKYDLYIMYLHRTLILNDEGYIYTHLRE